MAVLTVTVVGINYDVGNNMAVVTVGTLQCIIGCGNHLDMGLRGVPIGKIVIFGKMTDITVTGTAESMICGDTAQLSICSRVVMAKSTGTAVNIVNNTGTGMTGYTFISTCFDKLLMGLELMR